jgi:hypothetical protein
LVLDWYIIFYSRIKSPSTENGMSTLTNTENAHATNLGIG